MYVLSPKLSNQAASIYILLQNHNPGCIVSLCFLFSGSQSIPPSALDNPNTNSFFLFKCVHIIFYFCRQDYAKVQTLSFKTYRHYLGLNWPICFFLLFCFLRLFFLMQDCFFFIFMSLFVLKYYLNLNKCIHVMLKFPRPSSLPVLSIFCCLTTSRPIIFLQRLLY